MRVCSIWTNTCSLSLPPSSKSVREKLHTRLVQPRTQDSLSPKLPVGGQYAWKGQDVGISHPASVPVAKATFFTMSATKKWASLPAPILHMEQGLQLECSTTENTGALMPLPWLVKHQLILWEKQAKKTWGYYHLFTECSAPKVEVTLTEKHITVPNSSTRTMTQRFCLGEKQTVKQRALNLFPEEMILFATECEEVWD